MSENQTPPPPAAGEPTDPNVKLPPKRRRRWPWVIGGLFLALVLLVILLPTIISLGAVRSMVVPRISSSVAPNGKLEIDSWSFGWFSGQKIDGIRVLDDQNAVVAHLNVSTGASLLAVARGNLDVGQTTVSGDFDVRIDPETGRVNLLHILGQDQPAPKPDPTDAPPKTPDEPSKGPAPTEPSKPIEIPDLKGKVLVDLTGTISSTRPDLKTIPFTKVETARLNLDLTNIENGVGVDGLIRATVDGKPASVTLSGTADAVENRLLLTDPNKIAANLNTKIDRLDLALVNTVLSAIGMTDQTVGGLLQGSLAIKLDPGGAASIKSGDNLGIDNLVYTDAALSGDTVSLKRTDLLLNIVRQPQSGAFEISNTGLKTDIASVDLSGSVPQQAIQNLIEQKAPGAKGAVKIVATVPDFARITSMLPNTVALKEGTSITGGGLSSTTDIDIQPDALVVTQNATIDAAGTADGKPITLEKSTLNANATLAMRDGQPIDLNSVKALALDLVSPFATIKGNGVPEKIAFDGKIDATRAKQNLSQFVDLGDKDFGGIINFALNTQGLPTNTSEPLAAKLTFDTDQLTYAQGGETLLQNEKFNGTVDLLFKQTADAKTITFKQLLVSTESGLLGIWTAGDSQWVTLFNNGAIAGEAKILSRIRPDKLAAMFAKNVDRSMKLTRGVLDSTLELALDKDKNEYRINLQSDLNKLDVGDLLKNERLQLGVTMFVPSTLTASKAWFEVASNFVSVKGEADVKLTDPKGAEISPLDRVQKLAFNGEVPSIAKLHALASSFTGQAPTPQGSEPLPPLVVRKGSAVFSGTVSRDQAKQLLNVTFEVPGVTDLELSRGTSSYRQEEPITVAFAANLETVNATTQTLLDQIKRVVVSKLDAEVPGIVTVSMPTPIEVTGLANKTPNANGAIKASGYLEPLGTFLGVLNGSNPLPVSGTFNTEQTIATKGDAITVAGGATLSSLQPTARDATRLPEQLQTIQLSNDLLADLKAMAATIRKFELVVPNARDVLAVSAVGTVKELGTRNAFDGLKATVAYDLPQLWPIAQPFVDPTGESIGKIEGLKGKYTKTFTVAGSYPTADAKGNVIPSNVSIRSVEVAGDIQVDYANLVDKGIEVSDIAIPITLKDGIAKTLYANGSGPKPFKANGGDVSIGGFAVDLTGPEPVLVRAKNYQLVKGATLNPVLSNALGKFFNPVFPNATKAKALVDVKLDADKLHLGESLFTKNSGKAVVTLSLRDMEISNPLGEQLLGGVINKAGGALNFGGIDTGDFRNFRGELKDATFTLDRGVVTQNATFMIGGVESVDKQGNAKLYPFTFTGNVALANLEMNLAAGLPTQLIRNKAKGELADILAFVPDNLPIGLRGPTTNARADFSKLGGVFTEALTKYGASQLLGGDKKKDDGKQSDLEKAGDILGGLLGGKKQSEPAPDNAGREEKPREEKRREERPRDERPRDERPRDDRPRNDRPRNDAPRNGNNDDGR